MHRGFADECRQKLEEDPQSPKSIYNLINSAFEMMPLAAVIEEKFLCVHSGIGSSLQLLRDLEAVRKPVVLVRSSEDVGVQLALEIILSEPTEKDTGVSVSSSRDGAIIKFGISRLRRFLADNSLLSVIRGHDTVSEGLEVHWNGELQTLISATDYAGQYKNAGAVLIVKKSQAQTHKLISPLPDVLQGCWLQQSRPVTPVRRGLRS
jgi:protein phosphatase